MTKIPYGYCQCGCGRKTQIIKSSCASKGHVKGQPYLYCQGHGRWAKPEPQYIKKDRGYRSRCWIWQRATVNGYPRAWNYKGTNSGNQVMAHRQAWEKINGPIPAGYQLHHLCHQRECVNPAHLEAISPMRHARTRRNAKLTIEKARAIRRKQAAGQSKLSLSREYGVTPATIYKVIKGHSWAEEHNV